MGSNIVVTQMGAVTQTCPSGEVVEDADGVILNPASGLDEINYGAALKGSYPSPAYLEGVDDTIVAGLTATDGVERALGNNHCSITVNSLTGSGSVTFTGDTIDESSGAITTGDTENITVDATGRYQTDKKWLRISGITIPGGISAINYDVERLGYYDFNNNDFRLIGFRLEVTPTNATTVSIQIQMFKVQDDGSGKMTLATIEDITYKGTTDWIVDTKRGTRGYTTASSTQFKIGVPSVMKMGDYNTYFSSDENVIEGSTKNEGIIVKITWSNVDYINLIQRTIPGTGA